MLKERRALLVVLLSLLLTLEESPAAQRLLSSARYTIHWTTFHGATLSELKTALDTHGPKDPYLVSRYAVTSWKIGWRFVPDAQTKAVQDVLISTDIRVVLPKWSPGETVEPETYQRWSQIFRALIAHEYDHAQEPFRTVERIQDDIDAHQKIGALMPLKADAIIRRHIAANNRWDRQYDLLTSHGKAQGVIFP